MFRILIVSFFIVSLCACSEPDVQQTCKGEWQYILNDSTYCELLINDSIVFPYHDNVISQFSYRYKIQNDSFFIYGNAGNDYLESSPIEYLGTDSFRILGITPATIKRLPQQAAGTYNLARYHYQLYQLLRPKDPATLYEMDAFAYMSEARARFEALFRARRDLALYKRRKLKERQAL